MLPMVEPISGPTPSSSGCRPRPPRYRRTASATARSSPGGLGIAASSMKKSRAGPDSTKRSYDLRPVSVAEDLIQTALIGEAIDDGPALVFVADETMRYVAVNDTACRTLGYSRDELLRLEVRDVARDPAAPTEYDEMLARGFRHGTAILTCKDGTSLEFFYRAAQTTVAGLTFFVSVGFV